MGRFYHEDDDDLSLGDLRRLAEQQEEINFLTASYAILDTACKTSITAVKRLTVPLDQLPLSDLTDWEN